MSFSCFERVGRWKSIRSRIKIVPYRGDNTNSCGSIQRYRKYKTVLHSRYLEPLSPRPGGVSFGIEDTSHSVAGRPSRALARGYFVTKGELCGCRTNNIKKAKTTKTKIRLPVVHSL
eukprot:sb/3476518/